MLVRCQNDREAFLGQCPVVLDGSLSDFDLGGDLGNRETAENLERYNERGAVVFRGESFKRLLGDLKPFIVRRNTRKNRFIEFLLRRPSTSLIRPMAPGVVDQHMSHDARCDGVRGAV